MEFGGSYGFQHLPSARFPAFEKKEMKEMLAKWAMSDGLRVQAYSFSKPFKMYLHEDFIQDFFACPAVTSTLEKATTDHKFISIGAPGEKVRFSLVKCNHTTMELFDPILENENIVRKSGAIVKCNPEYFQPKKYIDSSAYGNFGDFSVAEIEVGDNLRKVILHARIPSLFEQEFELEEDLEQLLNPGDKDEYLFKLFSHLVLGGSLCQYEDNITPYLEATKGLYKELVGVAKSPDGEDIRVISSAFQIHGLFNKSHFGEERDLLFNKPELNNFCYLIVNPVKQVCFVLYHHV